MSGGLLSARRAHELLWRDLHLLVLDIETLWESGNSLPDEIDAELAAAIEQVKTTGEAVRLRPRARRIRLFEHRAIEAAGLLSESSGDEPDRAVEVRPGSGTPTPEPVVTHEGRHRAISIALVECERGKPKGRPWHRLVNPGVPVDLKTLDIHGLTTARLAGAPSFEAIAPELLERLRPAVGETRVLVAHSSPFDVGVLRTEFELLGHTLPDLPIIDTQGPLVRALGVHPADGTLDSLLVALRLTNAAPHTATGDAEATAAAVLELLRLATEQGYAHVPALLELAGGRHTAAITRPVGRIHERRARERVMPLEHLERHTILPVQPAKREIAAWVELADECALLRCPELGRSHTSLVRTAEADPATLLDALAHVLRRRAAAKDGPGANTVLGAIAAVFERFCPMPMPGYTGRYPIRRRPAIAIYHGAMALVAGLPECIWGAGCADCSAGAPCPRYELARALAPSVLDPSFVDGKLTRGSTVMAWIRPDEVAGWFFHRQDPAITRIAANGGSPAGPALADAATALLLRTYAIHGEEADRLSRVRDLLTHVITAGCADPAVVERWAVRLAEGGRPGDLRAAIEACERTLETRPKRGEVAWESLALVRDHLAGRFGRMEDRKRITPDGEIVAVRRHHPGAAAKRIRPPRFVRA